MRRSVRRGLPTALLWAAVLGGCGAEPEAVRPSPIRFERLALARHGHRIERVGDVLVALGGFSHRPGPDRGKTACLTFRLPAGPWQPAAPMPRGRAFFASGSRDGRVYALGETIDVFDPAADRWRSLPAGPALPKSHVASAVVGGHLRVLGGFPAEAAGHHVLDLASGTLRAAPPPPGFVPGDHLHLLAALRGHLHVVGGLDGESFRPKRAHHALVDGAWVSRAEPPTGLWAKFAAHGVLGDTFYVFAMEGSYAYDVSEDAWRRVAAMPEVRAMPATVVLDGRIVVLGGTVVEGTGGGVLVYDPSADRWTRHAPEAPQGAPR